MKFPTPLPRTKTSAIDQWRTGSRMLAYGYIASSEHGCVSNIELAHALGMDPRGLRQVIQSDPHFLIEIRADPGQRGSPWYRINAALKRPQDVAPPQNLLRLVQVRPAVQAIDAPMGAQS